MIEDAGIAVCKSSVYVKNGIKFPDLVYSGIIFDSSSELKQK